MEDSIPVTCMHLGAHACIYIHTCVLLHKCMGANTHTVILGSMEKLV